MTNKIRGGAFRLTGLKDDIAETLTLLPCKQAIFRVSLIHICGISH